MISSAAKARTVTIDVVSDTVCPWCFVGKRRLEAAMRAVPDLLYTVKWHPFQLDPTLPITGVDKLSRYEAKFGKQNIGAMLSNMLEVGKREGISFDYGGKIANTVDSHRLLEWAARKGGPAVQNALTERLFSFYFERQGDLSDHSALSHEAAAVGLSQVDAIDLLKSQEVRWLSFYYCNESTN